jgi:Kelch motif.
MKKKSSTYHSGPARRILGEGGFLGRRLLVAVLLCTGVACLLLPGTSPATADKVAFLPREAPAKAAQRTLTFAERVSYQRAMEEVYWRHRIWPKERPDSKPSLDKVMTQGQLEKKVTDYLRNSQALEDYWQRPITADQLQAEMERMAQHTKQPEVLRELFEALGNDPFAIAECLVRPVLAERLLVNSYAYDQRIHGELKQRAEADLQAHNRVDQMKQLRGEYSEIEFVKSDNSQRASNHDPGHSAKLNTREWDQNMQKLAATFNKSSAAKHDETVPVGKLSPVQQDENRYYATAVIEKGKDRLTLARVAWQKQPLRSWLASVEDQVPATITAASANYMLPSVSDGATCTDDTWTSTNDVPVSGSGHTAVWTGSEMIVWGGRNDTIFMGDLNTGGKYNPSTDTWVATSTTNAPTARAGHTAVWTGSEMIVWGGQDENLGLLAIGAKYNPSTDSWAATTTASAPTARQYHTAVWTGNEMIIWGGNDGLSSSSTGGRYNPSSDSWVATANAPTSRQFHTAVWTGSEMIIWGGVEGSSFSNAGARYNPSTNSWTTISTTNAPTAREFHTAVWSGNEMIVWGGETGPLFNTGGRYNPSTDSWTATSTTNAPSARQFHTAVWTGSEMIIWGGEGLDFVNTGGRYDPSTDSWTATSINNVPPASFGYTAVWTGTEMIVWGGFGGSDSGGRYNPSTDSWVATANRPTARGGHTAVWTGSEMIVWGGNDGLDTGGRYNPSTDSWRPTSTANAPAGRGEHTAVWSGSEMIVWGGHGNGQYWNTGGRYNPDTNSWLPTSTANAPTSRFRHTAIWTGSKMIVWGGSNGSNDLDTGGIYNPSTDSWTPTTLTNAPAARNWHTAVWTGSEMIVWGAFGNTGGRYDPDTNSWTATSTINAPEGRYAHTAVWTGFEMIIWGGFNDFGVNTGGRYNPSTDSWTPTSTVNAPGGVGIPTAIWTGSEMIVWGGNGGCAFNMCTTDAGGRYNPSTDSWTATTLTNAPSARDRHTAVWTGSEMIVWGGAGYLVGFNTGGRYCAQPPSVLSQLGNISTRAFVQTGDHVMIGGFIVRGSQPKRVIIRAIGPELTRYGVPNPLFNPTLELHDGTGALIASNDNWITTIIGGIITSNQVAEIRHSGHAPRDGRESAIIADLPPGNYTGIVRGVDNMTGVALAEVYDISGDASSTLGNISTRALVQTDDNAMIGGFIVEGTQPNRVIIRAIGPELSAPPFNIPNALADPTLEIHDQTGALIASNDNWQHTIIGGIITSDQVAAIRASGHAPGDPRESAIIATLPPGNYTAIIRGINNTTGVALVEVYDLH